MHLGNIMITQSPEPVEKTAYIIDFGLSTNARNSLTPYRSDRAGVDFTYNDDYGIMESLRTAFLNLK